MNLVGKRVLLTGASGGIGEALAQELAAQGAHLLLHGRRQSVLERLGKSLPNPEHHQVVIADLGSALGRSRLLQHPALTDGLDILINNAGCNQFAWLEDQSVEQVEHQLLLNIEAPIQLTRALLPRLHKPGIIMNIGSSLGSIDHPGYSVYCASKFALRGFSEALGRELEGSGIKVLHFAPRATRTTLNSAAAYEMNAALGTRTDSPQQVATAAVIALCRETRRRWLGWPEQLFVRLNALLPPTSSTRRWPDSYPLSNVMPAHFRKGQVTMAPTVWCQPPCPTLTRPNRSINMNLARYTITSGAIVMLLGSPSLMAADAMIPIQQQWAVCQYQQSGKAQERCLETLSAQAEAASAKEPFRADLLIWSAIVKSTWAGAKGGLGALSLVKEAKATLELAIKQDPKALAGSAYTSLGSLYYQVPGWPIGFGDNKKAEQLLKQALTINPDGIDPNFFYGDFLLDQGRNAEAKIYFDKALAAPARPGRQVADEGRKMEIRERLAKL